MGIEYCYFRSCFEYLAIKQLALIRLKNAVDNYSVNSLKQQVYSIHTSYRANECCQVVYVSNVAFTLGKSLKTPPLEVAKSLASYYETDTRQKDFIITVVQPGFLQLKLTDLKLANWLQCLPFLPLMLANLPLPGYSNLLSTNSSGLFAIQSAHARCYSLMQLAQREGLINLEEISANKIKSMFAGLDTAFQEGNILIFTHPQPLPWLNYRQQLQFEHRADYALIIQLVKAVDDLCSSSQSNLNYWAKTALNLSQAFAEFLSHCRIFGETNAQLPKLAQGRLGLILGTYVVLKLLLRRLGAFAPQEL